MITKLALVVTALLAASPAFAIQAKREAAERARRLSLEFSSEADRTRALRFADELDAEADALEGTTIRKPPVTTQQQVQVQQGPPVNDDEDDKSKP